MKQYAVAEYRPLRVGLIPISYRWEPILDTDNLKRAIDCQQNWYNFTGYKTVIIDFKKKVVR